jgi:hypothetical protein
MSSWFGETIAGHDRPPQLSEENKSDESDESKERKIVAGQTLVARSSEVGTMIYRRAKDKLGLKKALKSRENNLALKHTMKGSGSRVTSKKIKCRRREFRESRFENEVQDERRG